MKNTFKKLAKYMGSRKPLFPLALVLSALSALAGIAPFILVWLIVREMFGGSDLAIDKVTDYALWAVDPVGF